MLQIVPEWRLRDQLALFGLRESVFADCLPNARSMSQEASEINNYEKHFDRITYNKGFSSKIFKFHTNYLFII